MGQGMPLNANTGTRSLGINLALLAATKQPSIEMLSPRELVPDRALWLDNAPSLWNQMESVPLPVRESPQDWSLEGWTPPTGIPLVVYPSANREEPLILRCRHFL